MKRSNTAALNGATCGASRISQSASTTTTTLPPRADGTEALFGNPRGLTPAQVAPAWLLARKPWIVPIPGTTKLAHLQENLGAADFAFTAEELQELTAAVSKISIVGEGYTGTQAEQTNR